MSTRKYKRGNDEINLDDWLNDVSKGWDTFERSLIGRQYINSEGKRIKITEKDISGIRLAYDNLYKRLNTNDGSVLYSYDTATKGFVDSNGVLNSELNPYDGIVAKHFGDSLRKMSVYTEPEDPNKIKYDNNAIAKAITKRALGDNSNMQYWDMLDSVDPNTKKRTNTQRTLLFRNILGSLVADWITGNSEMYGYTEDQKKLKIQEIEDLYPLFDKDHVITENEYLQIARVLGMNNILSWFTVDPITTNLLQLTPLDVYSNFIKHLMTNVPYYTGNTFNYKLSDYSELRRLGPWTQQKVADFFSNATEDDLYNLLQEMFLTNDYRKYTFVKNIFPSTMQFPLAPNFKKTWSFLWDNVILKLKNIPGNLIELGPGVYHLPKTVTNRNTVIVYDDNKQEIKEVSIHDIPYYRNKLMEEYLSNNTNIELDPRLVSLYNIPRNKEGGILFAKNGAVANRNSSTDNDKWLAVKNTFENAQNIELWNGYYNQNDILDDIFKALKSIQTPTALQIEKSSYRPEEVNRFWEYGYTLGNDGNPVKKLSVSLLVGLFNKLNNVGKNLKWKQIVDDRGYKEWNELFDQTGLNFYFGADHDKFDFIGPSTWSRKKLLGYLQQTFNNSNSALTIGNESMYYDGNEWKLVNLSEKDTQGTNLEESTSTNIASNILTSTEINTEGDKETNEEGDKKNNGEDSKDEEIITEELKNKNKGYHNNVSTFAPELLDALRLNLALKYNKKIEKALQPHLSLLNPLNIDRPVLGNMAVESAYRREGAKALYSSFLNSDVDADRNMARMSDALNRKSELDIKGSLANNDAIKKSTEAKFNLAKESAQFNLQRYDQNSDRISKYLDTKGNVAASRLLKDFNGIDLYLVRGITQWMADNKERKDNILADQKEYDELYNANKYKNEVELIQNLISAYTKAHPTESISSASWFIKSRRRLLELEERLKNDNLISSGLRRGYNGYTDLFKDNPYVLLDWSDIIK